MCVRTMSREYGPRIHLQCILWMLVIISALLSWNQYFESSLEGKKERLDLVFTLPSDVDPAAASALTVGLGFQRIPTRMNFRPRYLFTDSAPKFTLILLLLCGDVECNPGPATNSIFPCGFCELPVGWQDMALCCDCCDIWFHRSCLSLSESRYNALGQCDESWKCYRCHTVMSMSSIFHSYEINTAPTQTANSQGNYSGQYLNSTSPVSFVPTRSSTPNRLIETETHPPQTSGEPAFLVTQHGHFSLTQMAIQTTQGNQRILCLVSQIRGER